MKFNNEVFYYTKDNKKFYSKNTTEKLKNLENLIAKLKSYILRQKIEIKDKTLTTKFISNQKNLVGSIEAPNMELADCEFGIYDTSQLLKLIGITPPAVMTQKSLL